MKRQLYNVNEAAEYLNCSRRTVYRLVSDGDLQALRVRSSLRIPAGSLDSYIQRQIAEFQADEGVCVTDRAKE